MLMIVAYNVNMLFNIVLNVVHDVGEDVCTEVRQLRHQNLFRTLLSLRSQSLTGCRAFSELRNITQTLAPGQEDHSAH